MLLHFDSNKDLQEMARVGWVPLGTTKNIEVYVHTDDSGDIPHFHVRKYGKNNNFEWEVCIKFESAEYFEHGRYKGKLPKSVTSELDSMLRTVNMRRRGLTYWQSAVDDWNNNNSKKFLNPDLEQPDYTKLK